MLLENLFMSLMASKDHLRFWPEALPAPPKSARTRPAPGRPSLPVQQGEALGCQDLCDKIGSTWIV